MLYSASHNFVFIHISKNGGSSIRSHLDQYAIQQTRTGMWPEFVSSFPIRQRPENIAVLPHLNARQVRRKLGFDVFRQAFSFAIVRNPYDRVVSRYEFIKQTTGHHQNRRFQNMTFEGFIKDERSRNLFVSRTQLSEVTDAKGDVIVSKIYKFEEFDSILSDICQKIGIKNSDQVPHVNSSSRKDYRRYFTPATRNAFDKIYRCDLDEFSYEF